MQSTRDDSINVHLQYPLSEEFDYDAKLVKIDLDKARLVDVTTGNGFVITEPKSIKKDIKDPNGIFSTRYGRTLQDMDPFEDRYKCECGYIKSRVMHGIECPICHTKVRYVDDNFSYFGWICLKDPYFIIHPGLYKQLSFFIGEKKLARIIAPVDEKDQDGFSSDTQNKPKDEPFYGIGLMDFKERFDEVMEYYSKSHSAKLDYYNEIMKDKDKVFTQSIPVYTTHLRPFRIESSTLFYEGTNAIYNLMAKLSAQINKDDLKIFRKKKPKNQLLYDLQMKYIELYNELEKTLRGKKGSIRNLFGGRLIK